MPGWDWSNRMSWPKRREEPSQWLAEDSSYTNSVSEDMNEAALGVWVKNQRAAYQRGELRAAHVQSSKSPPGVGLLAIPPGPCTLPLLKNGFMARRFRGSSPAAPTPRHTQAFTTHAPGRPRTTGPRSNGSRNWPSRNGLRSTTTRWRRCNPCPGGCGRPTLLLGKIPQGGSRSVTAMRTAVPRPLRGSGHAGLPVDDVGVGATAHIRAGGVAAGQRATVAQEWNRTYAELRDVLTRQTTFPDAGHLCRWAARHVEALQAARRQRQKSKLSMRVDADRVRR